MRRACCYENEVEIQWKYRKDMDTVTRAGGSGKRPYVIGSWRPALSGNPEIEVRHKTRSIVLLDLIILSFFCRLLISQTHTTRHLFFEV